MVATMPKFTIVVMDYNVASLKLTVITNYYLEGDYQQAAVTVYRNTSMKCGNFLL